MQYIFFLLIIIICAGGGSKITEDGYICARNPQRVIADAVETYKQGNFYCSYYGKYADEINPAPPPGNITALELLIPSVWERFKRRNDLNDFLKFYCYRKDGIEIIIGEKMGYITEMYEKSASNNAILERYFLDKKLIPIKGAGSYHAIYFDEKNNLIGEIFRSEGTCSYVEKYFIDPETKQAIGGPFSSYEYIELPHGYAVTVNTRSFDYTDVRLSLLDGNLRKADYRTFRSLRYSEYLGLIVGAHPYMNNIQILIDPNNFKFIAEGEEFELITAGGTKYLIKKDCYWRTNYLLDYEGNVLLGPFGEIKYDEAKKKFFTTHRGTYDKWQPAIIK